MKLRCGFCELRTEFLNIIWTSFDVRGLKSYEIQISLVKTVRISKEHCYVKIN